MEEQPRGSIFEPTTEADISRARVNRKLSGTEQQGRRFPVRLDAAREQSPEEFARDLRARAEEVAEREIEHERRKRTEGEQ